MIQEISENYIKFIKKLTNEKKSSSKNYYIIIKYEDKNNEKIDIESLAIENLNNNFLKLKECLSRCGNIVQDIFIKEEIINILFSFFNNRIYFNN